MNTKQMLTWWVPLSSHNMVPRNAGHSSAAV